MDVKWGVRADLTLDATVNTDFAQVEADEEQVNLTRFPIFFPEKRPFFLENAQTFQLGQPQAIDLFFSRRIGISELGQPIDILAGGRLSGKLGGYNVGFLNMQTADAVNRRTGETIAAANNYTVLRMQREVGRSNFGAMMVNRQGVGDLAPADDFNRSYGLDLAWQATTNGKLFAFMARTDSPAAKGGADYAGRAYYFYANPVFSGGLGYSQVGDPVQPRGRLPAAPGVPEGRRPLRHFLPAKEVALDPPSPVHSRHQRVRRSRQQARELERPLPRVRDPAGRGRPHERCRGPAAGPSDAGLPGVSGRDGPAGRHSGRRVPSGTPRRWNTNQTPARRSTCRCAPRPAPSTMAITTGGRRGLACGSARGSSRRLAGTGTSSPCRAAASRTISSRPAVSYSFTSLASVQGLIQYNSQTSTISSNIRLALLDRSGTGLFVVFNDRRDNSALTREELLGRSFIVKYTRLLDF